MESNICNKLVDYSFSSSESDEPPSKKKVGIVHPVVQSPKTVLNQNLNLYLNQINKNHQLQKQFLKLLKTSLNNHMNQK